MNTIGYFEIQSSDTARDSKFYQSVFDWKFIREEFVPIEYYRIETKGINGGLLKRPAKVPPTESGTNAFTCSVQVENFDNTAQLILENGGQVAMTKFAIPGRCWQGILLTWIIMCLEFLKLIQTLNEQRMPCPGSSIFSTLVTRFYKVVAFKERHREQVGVRFIYFYAILKEDKKYLSNKYLYCTT